MSIPRAMSANYVIGLSAIEKNEGMTSRDLVNTMRIAKRNVMVYRDWETDRKSTRLNSSHSAKSRMPSSA